MNNHTVRFDNTEQRPSPLVASGAQAHVVDTRPLDYGTDADLGRAEVKDGQDVVDLLETGNVGHDIGMFETIPATGVGAGDMVLPLEEDGTGTAPFYGDLRAMHGERRTREEKAAGSAEKESEDDCEYRAVLLSTSWHSWHVVAIEARVARIKARVAELTGKPSNANDSVSQMLYGHEGTLEGPAHWSSAQWTCGIERTSNQQGRTGTESVSLAGIPTSSSLPTKSLLADHTADKSDIFRHLPVQPSSKIPERMVRGLGAAHFKRVIPESRDRMRAGKGKTEDLGVDEVDGRRNDTRMVDEYDPQYAEYSFPKAA
jgi:hypothetical protein